MSKLVISVLLLLSTALAATASSAPGTVRPINKIARVQLVMTVAYCPTAFTGAGALIQVDPTSGKWSIMKKFQWPKQISSQGCIALDDPAMLFDYASGNIYFDFTEAFGLIVELDVRTGITSAIQPHDAFFSGYENMAVLTSNVMLAGLTATVTQNGFCNNGCIGFGQFDITTQSKYKRLSVLPFKGIMDDTHFYDAQSKVYYTQASYDLRQGTARCAPKQSDLCLLAVDSTSGKLISSVYTNWTVYNYAPTKAANGQLLGFLEGFDSVCNDPFNNFLFAHVDLSTATATPIACISNSTVIDEGPWVSSFSLDQTMFATASGDAEAGAAQLVVLNPADGSTIVNNQLVGLGKALGAYQALFWVWDVQFMNI